MVQITAFEYAQFANLAYEDQDSFKTLNSSQIPNNWEALTLFKYPKDSAISGYSGTAFKRDNHIVIAHRGTSVIKSLKPDSLEIKEVIDTIDDYISDLQLWLNKKPQQFLAAQEYADQVIKKYPDCTISFTGHSLGAVLAQLSAAHYRTKAVVFDSPGAKEIIHRIIKSEPEEVIIYNSHPNIINSVNSHYSSPFLLKNIIICSKKPSVPDFILLTTKFHNMYNILQQFNTTNSLDTYATKLEAWPKNINEAYRYFISYDQNKILWDQCLLQQWQQSPALVKEYKTLETYKKNYIAKKLYSKDSDVIAITSKLFKEFELIKEGKLELKDSILHKLSTQESSEIFSLKSVMKSVKTFVIDKVIELGNKMLYKNIESRYDKFTSELKDLPGSDNTEDTTEL